jgi:hypothetical protein
VNLDVRWRAGFLSISNDGFTSSKVTIESEEEARKLIEWLEYYFNIGD